MSTETRILEIARSIRPDAWVDFASANQWSVGFASGKSETPDAYNADMTRVVVALKSAGLKVRVRKGDEHWPYVVVKVRV